MKTVCACVHSELDLEGARLRGILALHGCVQVLLEKEN